ncbi:MAG: polyribonucleotide nucleotidyltransferase [Candidatus Pacebacteria bacterium]|nr:polyribonucleotide nucleotidyltransferase [Candidatus Paceibacterota bacterium]MDD5721876.1 polyribonucleotide nucleotidyltransferase [Candidatus Paceibacterota bacterium]
MAIIKKQFSVKAGDKTINIEFSNLVEQANGSVMVKMGETIVLASAVMGTEDKADLGFFPLMVDYEEKYYAVGKIYGSRFVRRESRPSEIAILNGRLIDRTIRPLFSQQMRREVQVVVTCLSIDEKNDPDILGIIAASLALGVSNIPWQGPVAATRISWSKENGFIINAEYEEREKSDFSITISGPDNLINMLEAEADEVPEDIVKQAIKMAQEEITNLNKQLEKIINEVGVAKEEVMIKEWDLGLEKEIESFTKNKLETVLYLKSKTERNTQLDLLKTELIEYLEAKDFSPESLNDLNSILDEQINKIIHQNVLENEKRPDLRKLDEIRSLEMAIDILPRPHGSALFMRGETHVLSVVTLGSPGDVLLMQGMEVTGEKRFLHHYNFPSYSVGEIGPLRGPGRREIGHGALGERALFPIIPIQEEFPYTVRVVSEILSSNGSTSMAATCASSLALMASGVPIKEHVSGIAMGLMIDEKGKYKILTDIQGPEDHYGDMDFKAAGTKNGITALQMDVKIKGLTEDIIADVLDKAKKAREFILEKMNQVIPEPRENLSPFAPRIFTLKIKKELIGCLIGPGGKVINKIIEDNDVSIDIEDDGTVFVTAPDEQKAEAAIKDIKEVTKEFTAGEVVKGKVIQIKDFGAIVDLGGTKEGLLHISELAPWHVNKVEDIVRQDEELDLKIKKVEPNGKISLSLKDIRYSEEDKDRKKRSN